MLIFSLLIVPLNIFKNCYTIVLPFFINADIARVSLSTLSHPHSPIPLQDFLVEITCHAHHRYHRQTSDVGMKEFANAENKAAVEVVG